MNRPDFWKLRKEHTPFQWAVQQAIYQVAPYGEKRADKRAAVCTANQMVMHVAEKVGDEEFNQAVSSLANYLPKAEDYEDIDDMDALKRMREKKAE